MQEYNISLGSGMLKNLQTFLLGSSVHSLFHDHAVTSLNPAGKISVSLLYVASYGIFRVFQCFICSIEHGWF